MKKYSFITNNCQAVGLYNILNRQYDTPFIGSYFQSDEQFVKFCQNYDYYIKIKPIFKEPILPFDTMGEIKPGTYPTMFLDDIEISWIHEKNEEECLIKYNRRLERHLKKTPFFILGDSLLHQYHNENERIQLINKFTSINNSFYIYQNMAEEWKLYSHLDRNPGDGFARPTTWIRPDIVNKLIIQYFDSRPKHKNIIFHVYALCYNESRLLPHFLRHYKQADRIIILDNESTDNSIDIIKSFNREYRIFKTEGCFNDIIHKDIKNSIWKGSKDIADFVIIQDLDEFIHFPEFPYDLKRGFYNLKLLNTNYVYCKGFEMCCSDDLFDSIKDNNIINHICNGYEASNYNKCLIINPNTILETNYKEGSHELHPIPYSEPTNYNILLLHYKHMGVNWELNRRIELKNKILKTKNMISNYNFGFEYHKSKEDTLNYINQFHNKANNIFDIMFPNSVIYLGLAGRLGNQLFQIATSLAISFSLNRNCYLPYINNKYNYSKNIFHKLDTSFKNFDINKMLTLNENLKTQEFIENINIETEKNIGLYGYFQTSKYFDKYKKEILNLIQIPDNDILVVNKYIEDLKIKYNNKKLVGIHIRRGDYLSLRWELPKSYYEEAINYFKNLYENVEFVLFSDDINWAINNLNINEFSDKIDYQEIFIMSKMDGIIMSNSTFSWWSVYLGNIENVVTPYPWFKNSLYNKFIYNDKWHKIEW